MTSFSPVSTFKNAGHFIHEHSPEIAIATVLTVIGVSLIAIGILSNYYPSFHATGVFPGFYARLYKTSFLCFWGTLSLGSASIALAVTTEKGLKIIERIFDKFLG